MRARGASVGLARADTEMPDRVLRQHTNRRLALQRQEEKNVTRRTLIAVAMLPLLASVAASCGPSGRSEALPAVHMYEGPN